MFVCVETLIPSVPWGFPLLLLQRRASAAMTQQESWFGPECSSVADGPCA